MAKLHYQHKLNELKKEGKWANLLNIYPVWNGTMMA